MAGKIDVVLVNMPFTMPLTPSPALGILQAVLQAERISAASFYANLTFCEECSFERYKMISHCNRDEALGDWIFAGTAFPDFSPPDVEKYLRRVYRRNYVFWRMGIQKLIEMAWEMRGLAAPFVQKAAARVVELRPRIVGCTSMYTQHVAALALLRRVRELDPTIVTIMGGGNCESVMGLTTHRCFPFVDYVVSGEADELLPSLVRGIFLDGRGLDAARLPRGVFAPCHRTVGYPGDGERAQRATASDLERLPVPDYFDYFEQLARMPVLSKIVHAGVPLETSRGCWWGRCRFCAVPGRDMPFRSKSPDRVMAELDTLHDRHGATHFLFTDSLIDTDYYTTLLRELARRRRPFRLFYEMKSNISRNELSLLRDAGFAWIQPGIESFSTPHLECMNKGVKGWQHVRLLKCGSELGMRVIYNIVLRLPDERDEWLWEMARLIPWICHLQPPLSNARMRFDRFNYYVENRVELGLGLRAPESFGWIYPLQQKDRDSLVYTLVLEDEECLGDDPFLRGLLKGQAVSDLSGAINGWKRLRNSSSPPMLSMRDAPGKLLVRDTRPCAIEAEVELSGASRAVLLACADGVDEAGIFEHVGDQCPSSSECRRVVEDLVRRKFLLRMDGHLLTLVLPEPVPPIPNIKEHGGGYVDFSVLQGHADAYEHGSHDACASSVITGVGDGSTDSDGI
ncbi:MAG: RiPP maturation radical SAM C-methyltransferase [Acidobacteriota bacterium]